MVGPSPTRIRERMAAISDPKERAGARAAEVALTVGDIAEGLRVRRGDLTIEFDAAPQFILDRLGNVIGIDALVRVFRGATELEVDPHRVCINPPCLVPDGTFHQESLPDGTLYDAENYEENPRAAYLAWLESSIREIPNAAGWRTSGTVTTVFATAPGGDATVDSLSTVYATARSTAAATRDPHWAGQVLSGADYGCFESVLIFDTSGIADGDTVSAVVLSCDGSFNGSTTDFTVTAASSAYNGGVAVTGDWVAGASLSGQTTYATWATSGYSAGYNAFTSAGAAFESAINKTGNTAMMLYSSRHSDGTTPTGDEYVLFDDADSAGTTTDPKLDITHAGAAALPPRSLNINQSVARAAYW